jgi:hypothetical protein
MPEQPPSTIKVFYCYAREDKEFRDKLETHMAPLRRQYNLTTWSDREIRPGEDYEQTISARLSEADLVLLLISPYFIQSDYCYGKEMEQALARHRDGSCKVILILLRPTHWEDTPFSHLQLLPTNARAVKRWRDRDDAFYDVVGGIKELLTGFTQPLSSGMLAGVTLEQETEELASSVPVDVQQEPETQALQGGVEVDVQQEPTTESPGSSVLASSQQGLLPDQNKPPKPRPRRNFVMFAFTVIALLICFSAVFLISSAITPLLAPATSTPGPAWTTNNGSINVAGKWYSSQEGDKSETWNLSQSGNMITGMGTATVSFVNYSENVNGSIRGDIAMFTANVTYSIKAPILSPYIGNVSNFCSEYNLTVNTNGKYMTGYYTECNDRTENPVTFTRNMQ